MSAPDFGIHLGSGPDVDSGCDVDHVQGSATAPAEDEQTSLLLADHTTFRLGGPADKLVVARTEAELCEAVRAADEAGEPLLVLSGGSNLLVADEGFAGTVVKVATRGITADVSSCGGAYVRVQAGENWDDFVRYAVEQEWCGIEALSGIPGLVGSTPIQNVGAYGQDVSQTIASVRTFDRETGQLRTFAASDCQFAYRDSVFKQTRMPDGGPTGRYVVLEVHFQFELASLSAPVRYPELARRLEVEVGRRVPAARVREAVLALRASKGMVLDEADHDTWSAGSFFTNPLLSPQEAEQLPADAPRFDAGDGRVKSSAAWLIDHAGFEKGYGTPPATLSTKHTLALTNRGGARTADVLALAAEIRTGVSERFGVVLEPEPVLVGCRVQGEG